MNDICIFAEQCDNAIFSDNLNSINNLISKGEELNLAFSGAENRSYTKYILGNLYSAKSKLESEAFDILGENKPEYAIKAINNYRGALKEGDNLSIEIRRAIQANLIVMYKNFKRYIEAIELCEFHKNLSSNASDYPFIARYHKSCILFFLSEFLTDKRHQDLYQLQAYKLSDWLGANIDHCGHKKFKENFIDDQSILKIIKRGSSLLNNGYQYIEDINYTPKYGKGLEAQYRNWCAKNILFLNSLNDISQLPIVEQDILQFPTYNTPVSDEPYFSSAFSAIKREYSFARYLLFEGVFNKKCPNYEAKELYLIDTFDGICYEMRIEKIKAALRIGFSTFDSLINLLYTYFFERKHKEGLKFNGMHIKENFLKCTKQTNPFIEALYWMACDLFYFKDDDNKNNNHAKWDAPVPEVGKIRNIRNKLEHGWIRIADCMPAWGNDSKFDYAAILTKAEIEEYAMQILQYARNSIIYFTLAVSFNEKQKDNNINTKLFIPIKASTWGEK